MKATVREAGVSFTYFDVSGLTSDDRTKSRKSNIVRLVCPICEKLRDSLVLTTRGVEAGQPARAMCPTCDRERR